MQLFDSDLLNPKESPHLRCDLQGKTALIIGASSGLPATPYGYAVASGEEFARCLSGARVILAAQLRR
jgi:NAD(P)-dependent dehydrogenase (short-subunit alcohol dehydrogenase family)